MDSAATIRKVPSLRDDEEYRRLDDQRRSLGKERSELEREHADLIAQMGKKGNVSTDRARRVAAILGDAPTDCPLVDPRRLDEINMRLGDLAVAINEIGCRIAMVRYDAARRLVEPLRSDHLALVRSIALALIKAHEASVQYADFADALNTQSVNWSSLEPHPALLLGDPRDQNSKVATYVKAAHAKGAISADEMPVEWR
jgi:hypothetical protein